MRGTSLASSRCWREPLIEQGIFLSPDYPLTHLMLRRRQWHAHHRAPGGGRLRPGPSRALLGWRGRRVDHAPLAETDDLPERPATSLMAGVYYFGWRGPRPGSGSTPPNRCSSTTTWSRSTKMRCGAKQNGAPTARAPPSKSSGAGTATCRRSATSERQLTRSPRCRSRPRAAAHGGQDRRVVGSDPPLPANQVRRRGAWYRGELGSVSVPFIPRLTTCGTSLIGLRRPAGRSPRGQSRS